MRDSLLRAARAIAAEEGWQAVTIRRIAERLEYASPVLYQHFASKDALLRELMRVGFSEAAARLREAVATAQPDSRLVALATAYWDFAFSAPELYQAMNGLDGVPFGTAETPAEARDSFQAIRTALVDLAAGQDRRLADPDGAVDVLWAYLHGFVSLTLAGRIAGGPDRARALMLAGLPALFAAALA
jgi:AcrR family transcriptional regulator